MIKFFSKIRKNMIKENKVRNYMLYAIGEIVLVMIGILLALQVNTWNENRKDRDEEQELLKALQIDFKETKKRFEETLIRQNTVVNYSRRLLVLHERNQLLEKQDSIGDFVVFGALSWWRTEPVTGTYDAMIGAGNIGLLKNKELRRILAEFNAELTAGFEDHEYSIDLLTILTEKQSEFAFNLNYKGARSLLGLPDYQNSKENNIAIITQVKRLIKDRSFFGILSSKMAMEINRLERQKKMLAFVDEILNILDSELSNINME
jgi:Family of unknown function (DUF6090)